VQLETPDELRGRVSAFYQMSSRGGPAIGDVVIGAAAGVVGPVAALTLGGIVPMLTGLGFLSRPNLVREYAGVEEPDAAAGAVGADATPPDARPEGGPDPVGPDVPRAGDAATRRAGKD
jgi:hypothetical protein